METTINAVLQSECILLMLWHNQGVLRVPIITVCFIFLSPKWVSITLCVKREVRQSLETCNDKDDDDDDDDEVSVYDLKQGRFIRECGLAGDALLAPDPLCVCVCVCVCVCMWPLRPVFMWVCVCATSGPLWADKNSSASIHPSCPASNQHVCHCN